MAEWHCLLALPHCQYKKCASHWQLEVNFQVFFLYPTTLVLIMPLLITAKTVQNQLRRRGTTAPC